MASWGEIEAGEPELAARWRARLEAGIHKTIATLRADGSPRISGIETFFAEGDLWVGSMPGARKAADLQRDPRFALHGPSTDPPADWDGDAKLAGSAEEVTEPERWLRVFRTRGSDPPDAGAQLFRLDIAELVLTGLNDAKDMLVIEHWHEGRGRQRIERK